MRHLTEKGFMEKYLKELSLSDTSSVYKLIKEIPDNPRILVPLAYYVSGLDTREKFCKKSEALANEVERVLDGTDDSEIDRLLSTYEYLAGKKTREDNLKKLMHKKICQLLAEKKVTTYRMYTDLSLDPSNTNKYIKDCDCDRISIESVRQLLQYLQDK